VLSDFIPPFPERSPRILPVWQRLRLLSRDLLAGWEAEAFGWDFVSTRVLARRVFLCNSPESVQFAFSTKNASFEGKSWEMVRILEPLIGDSLFLTHGSHWRKRRRMVSPILHISRLSQFAPLMIEAAVEVRDRWAAVPESQTIDVLSEMERLAAEIIARTIFGRELGHHHAQEIAEGFTDYQRANFRLDFALLFGLPHWLPRLPRRGSKRAVQRISRVLDEIIANHRARGGEGDGSAISLLMNARDEETGAPLDDDALRNETMVLFIAGHETTANSMAWTLYLLSQAPEVEARMHEELDRVLGGRLPTFADVPRLTYTRAVFEESMRLYPPLPYLSRQVLEEEEFQGHKIPKGAVILVSPWLLHRHPKLWEKPDHFIPERFLPGGNRPASKFAYIPFSIGPRICAGAAFGMTEAVLCLAILKQAFRVRLKPGHDVQPLCRMTLRPGDHLPMRMERRQPMTAPEAAVPAAAAACPLGHG
jgi:cytochrome P450